MEKTLHATLKSYFEPDTGAHEVRVGPFIADIVGEHGIIEIQTAGLHRLRKKLATFLEVAPVTVVYPVAHKKWLLWTEHVTGEVKRRKSPKTGRFSDALPELYQIKSLLPEPNLRLVILLVDMEEQRLRSNRHRKGFLRVERIPLNIAARLDLRSPGDWAAFLPPGLPEPFLSKDFARATRLSLSKAQKALLVLSHVGTVERCGKQGNSILYRNAIPTNCR